MSAAICNAVETVFGTVPHRLCHYHFLKAAGKVMLGDDHDGLGCATRRATRRLRAIRRSLTGLLRENHELARPVIDLIDHIVSNTADMKAEGFPFDLPNLHYYARCEGAEPVLERFLHEAIQRYGYNDPAVACMRDLREQIRRTTQYLPHNPVKRLRRRFAEFEALRGILRPATVDRENRKAPLNWGTIVLPRTNNLSETGFRDFKRRLRRTTGNGNLSRQLDQTPAEAFYAEDLSCPDYTRIVFGGRTMAEALADIDRTTIRQAVEVMKEPPAPGIINHHFINRDDFYEAVQAKFSKILAVNTK